MRATWLPPALLSTPPPWRVGFPPTQPPRPLSTTRRFFETPARTLKSEFIDATPQPKSPRKHFGLDRFNDRHSLGSGGGSPAHRYDKASARAPNLHLAGSAAGSRIRH